MLAKFDLYNLIYVEPMIFIVMMNEKNSSTFFNYIIIKMI